MRMVLDTDVVIAALRSTTGASAALIRMAVAGQVTLLINVSLAFEYEAVAKRPEHCEAARLAPSAMEETIDAIVALCEPVPTHFRWRPQLHDADDEMILEAAVNGQADMIVTFNRKDYGAAPKSFGMDVLLPSEALERVRQWLKS